MKNCRPDRRLEWLAGKDLHIRSYPFSVRGLQRSWSLVFASDFHLCLPATRHVMDEVIEACRKLRPDLIVLGGDHTDLPCALPVFSCGIAALRETAPVTVIPGNHDGWFDPLPLQRRVQAAGAHWLPHGAPPVHWLPEPLHLGSDPAAEAPGGAFGILALHNPSAFPRAARHGWNLCLAGHLHGGQCIFVQRPTGDYPGRLLYPFCGPEFQRSNAHLIVSRGVNDTLPLRWNCPRDILHCTFTPCQGSSDSVGKKQPVASP
ncbi:MAG: metallophosphoesterase [Verrucomicrobiota bacterium]